MARGPVGGSPSAQGPSAVATEALLLWLFPTEALCSPLSSTHSALPGWGWPRHWGHRAPGPPAVLQGSFEFVLPLELRMAGVAFRPGKLGVPCSQPPSLLYASVALWEVWSVGKHYPQHGAACTCVCLYVLCLCARVCLCFTSPVRGVLALPGWYFLELSGEVSPWVALSSALRLGIRLFLFLWVLAALTLG